MRSLLSLCVLMALGCDSPPSRVVSTHWRSDRMGLVTNQYTNHDRCNRMQPGYRVVERWTTSSPWICGQVPAGNGQMMPMTCYEDVEMCRYVFDRREIGVLRHTEGMNRPVVPPDGPGERRDACWVRLEGQDELLPISCSRIGEFQTGHVLRPGQLK